MKWWLKKDGRSVFLKLFNKGGETSFTLWHISNFEEDMSTCSIDVYIQMK